MIFLLELVHFLVISLMVCVCIICGLLSFSRDGEIWFEHESADEWLERIIRERKKRRNNFLLTLVVATIVIGSVGHSVYNIRRTHIEPKKWVQVYKNGIDAKIKVEDLFENVITPKTVITHGDIKNNFDGMKQDLEQSVLDEKMNIVTIEAKNSVDTTRREAVLLKPDIVVRSNKPETDKGYMTALYYGESTVVTTWFGHKIDTTKEARAKIVINFESATEPSTKTLFDVK